MAAIIIHILTAFESLRPDLFSKPQTYISISLPDMPTWVSHQMIKSNMSKTDPAILIHAPLHLYCVFLYFFSNHGAAIHLVP